MTQKKPLILSALRAQMGDWVYYISFIKMKDISQRVSRAQLLYSSQTLQELLQRQLSKGRSKEISNYLILQNQRFFNAIVIGTYGGDPKWNEINIKPTRLAEHRIPQDMEGTFGFLVLDGAEKLFAIDGQHRVEGIRYAIKQDPTLENEEVCVILVKGIAAESRARDPEGYERTRRLFTTLNKYGKKVNKKDIIALDEDDAVAIITRRLVEEYPLFLEKKTSISGSTSISPTDKSSVTSINALYDGLNIYLKSGTNRGWKKFKRFYPGEDKIEELYQKVVELWDCYCEHFPPLKELKDSDPLGENASKYRHRDGGYFLFRPIGLLMSLKVVRHLMDSKDRTLEQAVELVAKAEMDLSKHPWAHLIWNPLNKKMITASVNRRAAEKILAFSLGVDLSLYKSDPETLKKEIADIQGKTIEEISLPLYV